MLFLFLISRFFFSIECWFCLNLSLICLPALLSANIYIYIHTSIYIIFLSQNDGSVNDEDYSYEMVVLNDGNGDISTACFCIKPHCCRCRVTDIYINDYKITQ